MSPRTGILPQAASEIELDPLYPLTEIGGPLACGPEALEHGGGAMPEPYRSLLVHESDMTSTLEAFWGEPIDLRPLARRKHGESLLREVLLVGRRSGRVLEYGAIRIALDAFGPGARAAILEGHQPLGSILSRFEVPYTSRPRLFFGLCAEPRIASHLGADGTHATGGPADTTLFGRCNVLASPAGVLADVVEILPPIQSGGELD
ncbi:MAG: hypothetical protein AAGN66_12460 [Acidobacteriota bacterium]